MDQASGLVLHQYWYLFSEKYLLRYATVKTRSAVWIKLHDEIPNTEVLDFLQWKIVLNKVSSKRD